LDAFMGKAHSNAYRQVAPFFSPRLTPRLKVICGRTRSNVEAAAREYGWDEAATDWEEVIARKDIDIVDVATPGDLHAPIAIAAARAGKVVFCEKPLANTVAEADRMLAAVEKARVLHMICQNYRRAPAVMLAKHLIDDGRIGDVRHYRGTYLQDWVADPKFPMVWRLDKTKAGSGALGDIAAHSIDLARFLVGEITEVSGDLKTFITERPLAGNARKKGTVTVDDAAMALVRFDSGAVGQSRRPAWPSAERTTTASRSTAAAAAGIRSRAHERARAVSGVGSAGGTRVQAHSRHRIGASLHEGLVAARAHHRLRAHVHAHGLRSARSDGGQEAAHPELRRRREEPARIGGDREVVAVAEMGSRVGPLGRA
jgi:predicted dehydrogenase